MISEAQPLLLAAGLLAEGTPPDSPRQLQQTLTDALNDFSAAVEASDPGHLHSARYALCALLDETIVSTHWGGIAWPEFSLLHHFHDQDYRGEDFFNLLEKAGRQRHDGILLLELFHLCLSLGYSGRFHQRRQTEASIKYLRSQVAARIEQYRTSAPPALSQPTTLKHQRRPLPLWILASLLAAFLLSANLGLSWYLSQAGEPVLKSIQDMARTTSR